MVYLFYVLLIFAISLLTISLLPPSFLEPAFRWATIPIIIVEALLVSVLLRALLRRVWRGFGELHHLRFEPAPTWFCSPDKITGTYRGRRFEFSYWHNNLLSRSARHTTSITFYTRCSGRRLEIRRRSVRFPEVSQSSDDRTFNARILVQSKPKYLAREILREEPLRRHLRRSIPFLSSVTITLFPSGRMVFHRLAPFWTVSQIQRTADLLSDLAKAAEHVPPRRRRRTTDTNSELD
jgi:hypothetical protein